GQTHPRRVHPPSPRRKRQGRLAHAQGDGHHRGHGADPDHAARPVLLRRRQRVQRAGHLPPRARRI
ncbi:MAG: Protein translocase subunit SecE, partial [uncultured Sphingomonadaceae bacterium]